MKAEFCVNEKIIEVRRNITCCPRKGELVTFDGETFFEVVEVINDFNTGRFVLQVEERPDYGVLCRDEQPPIDGYDDDEPEDDDDGDVDDFDYDEE